VRVLIISDDDSETERLKTAFREAGSAADSTNSMVAACEWAKSGRFQAIFSATASGRRIVEAPGEVAGQHNLGFEVVLLARTFTFDEWAEALQIGAFHVLDVLCDLPKAAEAARRASGSFS
jgi:DNA-binding NtrC family response regulator